jgi:23S rRNA pseudouridine1911/1915/1917 synthase
MNNSTAEKVLLQALVPAELAGRRLDQVLAYLFSDYSRSVLKTWVEKGYVQVNGEIKRPRDKVAEGDKLIIVAEVACIAAFQGEAIPLEMVYEDEHILVINKPVNFVVHPAAGNWQGTLLNALLYRLPELKQIPRVGIVHRLDKDTSGLMVVAKSMFAHTSLVSELQKRKISRFYEAVVKGVIPAGATINAPLGRHHKDRKRRAVVVNGKEAITHYRIIEKLPAHTHLRIQLETGRTHQIRVHMAHIYHPIVGDRVYGRYGLNLIKRQALHASALTLIHPVTKEEMSWQIPLPLDMQQLLVELRGKKTKFTGMY